MNREEAIDAWLAGDDFDDLLGAIEDDERDPDACDCGMCCECDDSDPGERR